MAVLQASFQKKKKKMLCAVRVQRVIFLKEQKSSTSEDFGKAKGSPNGDRVALGGRGEKGCEKL